MRPCCFGLKSQGSIRLLVTGAILYSIFQLWLWCFTFYIVAYLHHREVNFNSDDAIVKEGVENDTANSEVEGCKDCVQYILWMVESACYIIRGITEIGLDIWLFLVTIERSVTKCRTWLKIQYVMISITSILFFISSFEKFFHVYEIVVSLIEISYRCYMMWVVRAFIVDLSATSVPVRFH